MGMSEHHDTCQRFTNGTYWPPAPCNPTLAFPYSTPPRTACASSTSTRSPTSSTPRSSAASGQMAGARAHWSMPKSGWISPSSSAT
eukprot:99357-Prymnesium_polylepis.1